MGKGALTMTDPIMITAGGVLALLLPQSRKSLVVYEAPRPSQSFRRERARLRCRQAWRPPNFEVWNQRPVSRAQLSPVWLRESPWATRDYINQPRRHQGSVLHQTSSRRGLRFPARKTGCYRQLLVRRANLSGPKLGIRPATLRRRRRIRASQHLPQEKALSQRRKLV